VKAAIFVDRLAVGGGAAEWRTFGEGEGDVGSVLL